MLEVLVVLVIVGITIGALVLNASPGQRQVLHREAQRIAQLMQVARDEAIVRNQPIAFESTSAGYRFLIRQGSAWIPLAGDEILRERSFPLHALTLRLDPVAIEPGQPLRVVFEREPVNKAFTLTLSTGEERVLVRADGIGHFHVE